MSQNINEPIDPQSPIDSQAGTVGKSGILFAAAAGTGSVTGAYTSSERYNRSARGVRLNVVIAPTGAATGTVTVKLQVADPVSNSSSGTIWTDLPGATTAAINGTGALTGSLLTVYPGLTGIADAGTNVNQHLGCRWRAVATVALDTLKFTVGADYLM